MSHPARDKKMTAPMATKGEAVVLVHGLWLSGWAMALIARRLRHRGFDARCFSYPSVGRELRANATALDRFAAAIDAPVVNFVGHSLGGLVIQTLLNQHPPARPGRVVTLGTPYGGSLAARRLARWRIGRWLLGHAHAPLLAGVQRAPGNTRETGVLRGVVRLGIGLLVARIPSPHDGVVSHSEADLPGATDQITLPVCHTCMLISGRVAKQIGAFLKYGRFER